MVETIILEQANTMAALLPPLMRQLFATKHDLAAHLPLAQLRVCGILSGGPRSMSDLSRELGVSLSAMTQIADRLERARLVKRVAEGSDRRIKWLQLTRQAENMFHKRGQARLERILAVLEQLPPTTRGDVLHALELLQGACAALAAPAPSPEPEKNSRQNNSSLSRSKALL